MKTKILKFGMPVMAFLLAIVFAFASNEKPEANDTLVPGYIFWGNNCVVTEHDCTVQGNFVCELGALTVYGTKDGSICKNPLMRVK